MLALEAALARHRAIALAALAVLTLLAWVWLLLGAGMGWPASFWPFVPDRAQDMAMGMPMAERSMPMPGAASAPFALTFSMWWTMMAAMMLPSAAPVVLLYAGVAERSQVRPATASFLIGYLAAWGLFSLLATLLQWLSERFGLLAPMAMSSTSRWFSAGLLIVAGVYQLSPFKSVCLRHCRSPAQWLSAHYRPGRTGALRMGLLHGAYCVGCCWLLMLLLFAGGVMNLAWIATLTLMVAAEKLLPFGRHVALAAGAGCVVWGVLLAVQA